MRVPSSDGHRSVNGRSRIGKFSHAGCSAMMAVFAGLGISSTAWAVDNTQANYAGASGGDWSTPTNVIGAPDNNCSNMGAVGKANLVSNFGFAIPGGATITGVTAHIKAGENNGQNVGVQLASNAAIDPPTTIGSQQSLAVAAVGAGNCASTTESDVGPALAGWGLGSLSPATVNTANFGMVFTKIQTSSVKVDSICMEIHYTTAEGPATQEACFEEPPPVLNSIRVVKTVVGAAPGSDWEFGGDLGAFTLPAAGGFQDFADLDDASYEIIETVKPDYNVSVTCLINDVEVASGTAAVTVAVSGGESALCEFVNTEELPPPPEPPQTRATFVVTKDFSDDNPGDVEVHISCNTGLPLDQSKIINEAAGVEFVVTDFDPNVLALNCTITETALDGYETTYSAEGGELIPGGCVFEDVQDGDTFSCEVLNVPAPVTVTIEKDWVFENATGSDAVNTEYCVDLRCYGEIVDTTPYTSVSYYEGSGVYHAQWCDDSDATFEAEVVPEIFPETGCWVEESVYDSSVEVDNGCGGYRGEFDISVGNGYSCTITNTVFFEGIPTLNQYGMALLALLMLGIGFIGFRRFV